jgi:4-amino-4-deoxy-L-arabinose transferase-like glycosyltransferase
MAIGITGDIRIVAARDSDRRQQALLVALCLFLFFFYLGSRALWDVDEGMHSVSAKHVVETGDWVTPTYNGEPFLDKPMFFTWMVAISFFVFGFTEFAARFPAAVLGLAGVWLTYRLGRQMFGSRVGFFGGAVMATSVLYLVMARTVVHDSALGLFTTMALYLFYMGVAEPERRRTCFLLFYVALAGAVLAKGPLGVVLPGLVIGPYLVLTKRLGLIREMRLGWGILIFLVLSAPWYLMMDLRNEGYLTYFLIEKNFGSFASEESTHPAPFHFYIPVFLGGMLPWSFYMPAAVWRAFGRLRGEGRDAILYLILWVGMMFLFFSAATSKLASYLLPLMPAAALVVGLLWDEALNASKERVSRVLFWSQIPVAAVAVAGFVFGWLNPPLDLRVDYGISMTQVLVIGLIITLLSLLTLALLWRGRIQAAFASTVGIVAGILAIFSVWVGPSMDDYRSSRALALELDQMLPPTVPMVFFWREKDSALFYTDRDGVVLPTWEVGEYLASEEEVFFVAQDRHLHRIAEHRDRFGFVYRKGNKVVISNNPGAEDPAAVPEGLSR